MLLDLLIKTSVKVCFVFMNFMRNACLGWFKLSVIKLKRAGICGGEVIK